jgi:hypothetical protein
LWALKLLAKPVSSAQLEMHMQRHLSGGSTSTSLLGIANAGGAMLVVQWGA